MISRQIWNPILMTFLTICLNIVVLCQSSLGDVIPLILFCYQDRTVKKKSFAYSRGSLFMHKFVPLFHEPKMIIM